MSFASSVREVALRLIDLLEREGVPYAVMGGLAVPIWGIPRATFDVVPDAAYQREWAGRLGVQDRLERAIGG